MFDIFKYVPYKRLGKIGLVLYPIPLIMLVGIFYLVESVKGVSVDMQFAISGNGITDQVLGVSIPVYIWPVFALFTFLYGAMYMHLYHKPDSDERLRDIFIYGIAFAVLIKTISSTVQALILALEMWSIL